MAPWEGVGAELAPLEGFLGARECLGSRLGEQVSNDLGRSRKSSQATHGDYSRDRAGK